MRAFILCLAVTPVVCFGATANGQQNDLSGRAVTEAMKRAATFYKQNVAVHGGYVYFYSLDLQQRWGEGVAGPKQIWVQPPGTPTVGMAYLKAWHATGNRFYLDAAREAAEALAYGQFRSGGWNNSIDLKNFASGQPYSGGRRQSDGNSSLDDGQTQSALQLMIRTDHALDFQHVRIHNCATTALDALLAAQFPNGAFPQVWRKPVGDQPVMKASYPEYDWRTEGRIKEYWDMYTLNDNVCGYVVDTLLDAHSVYKDDRYLNAVKRLGDFLVLAQMPDPQPAWAQQYNYQMHPIWARKFEPAAIAGDESQEVIETLIKIFKATGDRKFLAPIPRALDYLEQSELPDGQLARYYELRTNRPLYMSRRGDTYMLTYDDSRLPKHYGWKWPSRVSDLRRKYTEVSSASDDDSLPVKSSADLVKEIIQELDDDGRWVSVYDGERLVGQAKMPIGARYLSSERFSSNLTTLSEFLLQMDGQ